MVDWSKPIEAVHADGRVVPVRTYPKSYYSPEKADYEIRPPVDGWGSFMSDGSSFDPSNPWRIRNVAEQPAWRTSAEQLDRMDALVNRLAATQDAGSIYAEARDILADREPVDPRLEKVLAGVRFGMPQLADRTARRLARDILKSLDAA